MWPLIIVGGLAAAAAAYEAFKDDDDSSSSDDSSYRREEALRQERESHNQTIKQEITTYVNGEVSKIEGSIKVMEKRHNTRLKWRWVPVSLGHGGGILGILGGTITIGAGEAIGATIASKAAATIGQTTDQALLRFSELGTPLLEEENERLKEEIKRLEEFKNAIQ